MGDEIPKCFSLISSVGEQTSCSPGDRHSGEEPLATEYDLTGQKVDPRSVILKGTGQTLDQPAGRSDHRRFSRRAEKKRRASKKKALVAKVFLWSRVFDLFH